MITDSKGKVHVLLESERFLGRKTLSTHYVRAWRREERIDGKYVFICFVLTHSTDTGLYYEESYNDLKSLAYRKSHILNYYGVTKGS